MITGKNTNPEKQIYYVGGLILELIANLNEEIDFFDIYQKVNKKDNISMNLYTLSLDWLFILGTIEQKNGKMVKCL